MADKLPARFGFPKLVVRDLHKQAAFYRAVVGYGEGQFLTGKINGRAVEEFIFSAPDGKVEMLVMAYVDGGPAPAPGAMICGMFTDDLEAFEARVLAAGGSVFQPIGPMDMPGMTARLAFYADPEGHLLEVIQAG
ncbi:MAG TPA: VOC family protein [Phenylobacterium sp.]|uniref:VOC family protein n=1 Tax=Phenylobacterium sp. TaxID=1871053 RepID=UPI002B47A84F|nr:VOC family protein [Phenylobacterium sp.]HKR25139.1 VOC family protein [Allosphingosinicella sp.]HKR87475.1 VOC family protein [Phenylobacterium sp.]